MKTTLLFFLSSSLETQNKNTHTYGEVLFFLPLFLWRIHEDPFPFFEDGVSSLCSLFTDCFPSFLSLPSQRSPKREEATKDEGGCGVQT